MICAPIANDQCVDEIEIVIIYFAIEIDDAQILAAFAQNIY